MSDWWHGLLVNITVEQMANDELPEELDPCLSTELVEWCKDTLGSEQVPDAVFDSEPNMQIWLDLDLRKLQYRIAGVMDSDDFSENERFAAFVMYRVLVWYRVMAGFAGSISIGGAARCCVAFESSLLDESTMWWDGVDTANPMNEHPAPQDAWSWALQDDCAWDAVFHSLESKNFIFRMFWDSKPQLSEVKSEDFQWALVSVHSLGNSAHGLKDRLASFLFVYSEMAKHGFANIEQYRDHERIKALLPDLV